MATAVVETSNLTKRYGEFTALDDLSIRVERGQILSASELLTVLQVNLVLICLAMSAVLTLVISTFISSLFHRTATATSTAYVVLLLVFLGPMIIWLGRDAPFGHETVQTALMINPMGAALSIMETPGFKQYELWPISWWVSGITTLVLLVALGTQVWRLNRPW